MARPAKPAAPPKLPPNIYAYAVRGGTRYKYKVRLDVARTTQAGELTHIWMEGGFADPADAVAALEKLKAQHTLGQIATTSTMLLGDWLDAWYHRHQRTLAEDSKILYERVLRLYLKPDLGSVPLAKLTPDRVSDFLSDLADHGGEKTRKVPQGKPLEYGTLIRVRAVLHAAMEAAVKRRLVPSNPVDDDTVPAKPKPKPGDKRKVKHWTEAQLRLFLTWAKENDPDNYDLWFVYSQTGARRHEITGIMWGDVDFEHKKLTLRIAKGNAPRVIEMFKPLADYLMWLRREREIQSPALAADDALVFFDGDGNALDKDWITKAFIKAAERAVKDLGPSKLPRITLHGVRHTIGTLTHYWGWAPKRAAAFMGHNVQTYLSIYVHDLDWGTEAKEAADSSFSGLVPA